MFDTLKSIKQSLHATPRTQDPSRQKPQAAVAAILRQGNLDLELLLIRRSQREGDPWSGHLAFPGGRLEEEDATPRGAAMRETFEEIGLNLQDSEFIGPLRPLTGLKLPISVSAYTFFIENTPTFHFSDEVASAFWVSFTALKAPESRTHYRHRRAGQIEPHEALRVLPPPTALALGNHLPIHPTTPESLKQLTSPKAIIRST